MRILLVASGANTTFRQTRLLFVTDAPGIVTHAAPFEYWISNARKPHELNVSACVGSTGAL